MVQNQAEIALLGAQRRIKKCLDNLVVQFEEKRKDLEQKYTLLTQAIQVLRALDEEEKETHSREEPPVSVTELQGLKHFDALKLIAQRNGNILDVNKAWQLMLKAKMFKKVENARASIYTHLSRSEEFERIERGRYRFLNPIQPSLDLETPEETELAP